MRGGVLGRKKKTRKMNPRLLRTSRPVAIRNNNDDYTILLFRKTVVDDFNIAFYEISGARPLTIRSTKTFRPTLAHDRKQLRTPLVININSYR